MEGNFCMHRTPKGLIMWNERSDKKVKT
ncbi:uncharacterized protein G2W53_038828 [Senna tora]|uniref:Uncharacterized protein n=1 Tax=Senna tora TaxID=362788 RepID=A0A834SMU1_9FABA|nr:uncharacterized protein G2W53_038828 [Senna tora]